MGGNPSRHRRGGMCEKNHVKGLKGKIRFIQEEVGEKSRKTMYERVKMNKNNNRNIISSGNTTRVYEKEMMAFAFKKAEWKQERKKLKEEVKMLKALVEEKDEKIREMEAEEEEKGGEEGVKGGLGGKGCGGVGKEWAFLGANFLVDQMREERARRDETVEKWKQLYLAIKMELDDLIQRTHEEEDMAEELKTDLLAKEETIKELKSRLASMEQELYKRDREVDILRQSLRIMTSKKVLHTHINNPPPKKIILKQGGKL